MTVSRRQITQATTAPATSITIGNGPDWEAPVDDNLIVIQVSQDGTAGSLTGPAGFTALTEVGAGINHNVFYKKAASEDANGYTVTSSNNNDMAAVMQELQGIDADDPVAAVLAETHAGAREMDVGSINVAVAETLVQILAGVDGLSFSETELPEDYQFVDQATEGSVSSALAERVVDAAGAEDPTPWPIIGGSQDSASHIIAWSASAVVVPPQVIDTSAESKLLISYINRMGAALLTGSPSVDDSPLVNAQVMPVALSYAATSNSVIIDFDLGSPQTLRLLGIFGTNLTETATRRIRLSNTISGASDVHESGTAVAGTLDGYRGNVFYDVGSEVTARFGRINLTSGSADPVQVGFLWAGPVWEPTTSQSLGEAISWSDNSDQALTPGTETLVDERPPFREFTFTIEHNDIAEMIQNGFELDRVAGSSRNIVVMLDADGLVQQKSMLCFASQTTPHIVWTFDSQRKTFILTERL